MTTAVQGEEVVAFLHNDVSGISRGRGFPASQLQRRLQLGVGWVPANQALTAFGPIAEPNPWGSRGDLRLLPDPDKQVRVDLWPGLSAVHFFLCDAVNLDGSPWDSCPRTLLKTALGQLEEEAGVRLLSAFEQEFQVSLPTDREQPALPFSFEALRASEPFASHLLSALKQADVDVENVLPEYGERQWELSCVPCLGVAAADQAVIVRELVREVARRLGGRATFAPLTHPDRTGNGLHIHFSFRDPSGRPVGFTPGASGGLGSLPGRFAAGVLAHLPALCAFTAPSAISYLRLTPHRWSAGYSFLGKQNREAALRLPASDDAASFNIEFRAADGACCPHLALAMLTFAGLDGIRRSLDPPLIWEQDPAELSDEERLARGIEPLPGSLASALTAVERDDYLRSCISEALLAAYISVKETEISMVADLPSEERCARYGDVY